MARDSYDVIIVGGGIMGCSTTFYLMSADTELKLAVIELYPTDERASTTLSLANARVQFSLKKSIQISQYAFDVLERFEEDMAVDEDKPSISYRREGNLFLTDENRREAAQKALDLQISLGCQVEWWSPEMISQGYPLYNAKYFAGGTFGSQDGHFDAYAMLMAYRTKAKSLGAEFIEDEVVEIKTSGKQVTGVALAEARHLSAGVVVNCAGAWAAQMAQTAGVSLPVAPVKRQVYVVDTKVKPEGPLPLTVLPSGLYFRTDTSGLILVGKSFDDDPVGFDFSWDDKRFREILWPELAEFVPAFDTLRLVRGWAGLYAVNTLDGNAILGEWPQLRGFYLANGFSGHGLQQAPAVGRFLSELILGHQPSLDLSIFEPGRILENKPLSEKGLV